ncbi:sensor histidine kinase, partial [Actinospica acidiphila]|nr:sensor histidine kinase [Actinospica acidiphila]
ERLAAADGTLRAGEGADGGFEVVAELPAHAAVREPSAAVRAAVTSPSGRRPTLLS